VNLPARCDVAVLGGGPAGSALAALLARAGRRPVLLERDRFPRRKVCGEFLSMEAQGLLARIGCAEPVRALGPAVIERARFFTAADHAAEFPLGAAAWGLSRWALDAALFRHARNCGAAAFEGADVVASAVLDGSTRLEVDLGPPGEPVRRVTLEAGTVVDARGRPPAPAGDGPFYIGYKRHHRPKPGRSPDSILRGAVEVHLFPGGYCGLNAVEGGAVNVCLLVRGDWLSALDSPRWDGVAQAMAARSPSLRRRLEALIPEGPPSAVARVRTAAPAAPRSLSVGDAAGMIAPLCGDGQAMALESALLMADLMGRTEPSRLAGEWSRAWSRRFAARIRVGRALQSLLLHPWGAELAVGLVNLYPPAARRFLQATRTSPNPDYERGTVPLS
jgi:flavin-dependent dehydrogenase